MRENHGIVSWRHAFLEAPKIEKMKEKKKTKPKRVGELDGKDLQHMGKKFKDKRDETVEYVCEITEFHLFPLIDSKSKLNFKRKDGVIDVVYDMETGCSLFFNF